MKIKQLLLLVAFFGTTAFAQNVTVTEAWARATVQGQKASGAFMKITAKDDEKLIGASSAAAGVVQIHEMKMEKDVMKMNAVDSIALPAGQTVVHLPQSTQASSESSCHWVKSESVSNPTAPRSS